jgi:hypothetical protein
MKIARPFAAAALAGLLAAPRAAAQRAPDFEAQAAEARRSLNEGRGPSAPATPPSAPVAPAPAANPLPSDQIQPAGLPMLGRWMLDDEGEVADWMGDLYEGKRFAEPINVVLRVDAGDPDAARAKLLRAVRAAGFADLYGHSSGYQGWLAGVLAQQYPRRATHAFSDAPFLLPNDHGRIFGPVLWRGREYFIGSFSREDVKIRLLPFKFRHPYASFARARERFVRRMGAARLVGYVAMDNAVAPTDPARTTGDHDGRAALLEIK